MVAVNGRVFHRTGSRQPFCGFVVYASVGIDCEISPPPILAKARFHLWKPGAVTLAFVVFSASVALRLVMLWRQGGLFSDIEYDDGVHLGSAVLLAHGHVLYRDQVFLHPPGISLLLLPFAWASDWLGQPATFALTRLTTVLVSAAVAGLLTYVVRRDRSWRRAVLAGGVAVVLAPSVVAGSTLMLEPWLGLFGLLAVERLTRRPARRIDASLAGICLGFATTIKAWGVIPLMAVAIWLLCERRNRESFRLVSAAGATIVVLIGPFLLLAGGRLLNDVAWTQLRRPPDGLQGLMARTANLLGRNAHQSAQGHLLVALVLAGIAVLMVRAAVTPGVARLSAITLAIAVPVFANAPSFFFHYGDFFTPWAALLIATQPAFGRSGQTVPKRLDLAALTAATLMIGLLHQTVDLVSRQKPADVRITSLQRTVGSHACVVSDQASLLLLADAFDRPACPSWLDPRGAALTELGVRQTPDFYPNGFQRLLLWQHEYVALMSHAQFLILTGEPCSHAEWTTATCRWVHQHFVRIADVGHAGPARISIQVWQRTARDGSQ